MNCCSLFERAELILESAHRKDSLAVTNIIAQIVARRCFEAGIQYVHCEFTDNELISKKLQVFVESLKKSGLILKEPEFFVPRRQKDL